MDLLDFEKKFSAQSDFNHINAKRLGLSVTDYVSLNASRLASSATLGVLLSELHEDTTVVPGEKYVELETVLCEMMNFAINNQLFEDATTVSGLLNRYHKVKPKFN